MAERLVVVGGGAAGMSAASAARRVDPRLEIVVLEATGHAGWGLCGLPYFVSGEVPQAADLFSYPAEVFRQQRGIDLRLGVRAVHLDPAKHQLTTLADGGSQAHLAYSALVVAAGGSAVVPRLPGLDDDRVYVVRDLDGARDLRSRVDAGMVGRALVVGGGYIGLEMAEALVARGCDVVVVEALDRVLTTLDPEPAGQVAEEVRRHADLRLGVGLTGVRRDGTRLRAALADGSEVEVDVVVLAVGVRPNGGIAAEAGALTSPEAALLVDDRLRTSLPDVLAAGDCVAVHHRVLGRPAFVPLGPAGNKAGRVAGTVAAGGDAVFPGVVGTAVVKVFDLCVARTGLTLGEAERAGITAVATDTSAKSRAKYYPGAATVWTRVVHTAGGRLLGAQMLSTDPATAKRIDVFATALHAGFDVGDVADLDLAYAPPYAPVYDPVLRAAQAALVRVEAPRAALASSAVAP